MTRFCQPCRNGVAQYPKAARRAAFLLLLMVLLSVLGAVSEPVNPPAMCHVYP